MSAEDIGQSEIKDRRTPRQGEPVAPSLPGAAAPIQESRTREYLANERTYLAWMRTAISLLGFSVIIIRIRAFQPPLAVGPGTTWQLGLLFALVGLVMVFLSTQHYFAVRYEIASDSYQPTGRWIILFSIAMLLMSSGIIYYVFTYAPGGTIGRG